MIERMLEYLLAHPPGGWMGPVLGLIAFIETLFPPFPGDIIFIVMSGWAQTGGLPMAGSALYGVAGCFLASCCLFLLGQKFGRRIVDGWLKSKVEPEKVNRAKELVSRHGPFILAASRFVPGLRSLLVLVAGTSGMRFAQAVVPIALSAAAWYLILSLAGSIFGKNLSAAESFMRQFEVWIWALLSIGLLMFLLLKLLSRRKSRK